MFKFCSLTLQNLGTGTFTDIFYFFTFNANVIILHSFNKTHQIVIEQNECIIKVVQGVSHFRTNLIESDMKSSLLHIKSYTSWVEPMPTKFS